MVVCGCVFASGAQLNKRISNLQLYASFLNTTGFVSNDFDIKETNVRIAAIHVYK
jgi:hypothetical protein